MLSSICIIASVSGFIGVKMIVLREKALPYLIGLGKNSVGTVIWSKVTTTRTITRITLKRHGTLNSTSDTSGWRNLSLKFFHNNNKIRLNEFIFNKRSLTTRRLKLRAHPSLSFKLDRYGLLPIRLFDRFSN